MTWLQLDPSPHAPAARWPWGARCRYRPPRQRRHRPGRRPGPRPGRRTRRCPSTRLVGSVCPLVPSLKRSACRLLKQPSHTELPKATSQPIGHKQVDGTMPLASLDAVHAVRQVWFAPAGARIRPVASATGQSRRPGCGLVEKLLAASGRAGGPRMGRAHRRGPRPWSRPCGDGRRRWTRRPGRSRRRPRSWAAGSTGGCWPRWSSWRGRRWSPPALDLPLLPSSATFSTFTAGGVTVVLTLDPAGCTVVTRIG